MLETKTTVINKTQGPLLGLVGEVKSKFKVNGVRYCRVQAPHTSFIAKATHLIIV